MKKPTGRDSQRILQARLEARLHEGATRNKQYMDAIEQTGVLMNDFIAPLGEHSNITFEGNGKVKAFIGKKEFSLHPHAVTQTAIKLGVPTGYVKELVQSDQGWKRQLIAHTLNEYSAHSPRQRVLVRAVGDEIRGVLSDQYRRLDTPVIFKSFLRAVNQQGAVVYDAFTDDTKSYIEVVKPDLLKVKTVHNGEVFMAFGARISSSDFGDGALEMRVFWLQAVCLNGAVAESKIRQVHLGSRIHDDIAFSAQTYKLDTKTQASAVSDIVRTMLDNDQIMKQAMMIQDASAEVIEVEKEIKLLPKVGLTADEAKEVQTVLLANKAEDGVQGEPTLWKLSQAVSAIGRDKQATRRKRELDEIAGMLMNRVAKK